MRTVIPNFEGGNGLVIKKIRLFTLYRGGPRTVTHLGEENKVSVFAIGEFTGCLIFGGKNLFPHPKIELYFF